MMEKIYNKGRRKEYQIIKKLKEEGWDIAQRTAGSHSPIDILAIKIKEKEIKLIQSKRKLDNTMDFTDNKQKRRIEEENKALNDVFVVQFEVL